MLEEEEAVAAAAVSHRQRAAGAAAAAGGGAEAGRVGVAQHQNMYQLPVSTVAPPPAGGEMSGKYK